jgi:phosphate-selective porin
MLTQAFSPPVANGLQVNGYQQFGSQQGINWAVGIFNADTVQAPEDTIGSNKSLGDRAFYNGNLGVTLLNEPSQGNTVHASVTYTHYEQGGEAQPFGANGGVTGTGFNDGVGVLPVVNTGRFGGIGSAKQKSTNLYDLGALVQLGPLSAEAEYARYRGGVKGQDITREKLNYDGYYAQVGYVLTGEHRTFDPKEGYLKGVEKPDHSYGAWELIARYDSLDLKSNAGAGGARIGNRGRATTVGVNWYVNQNLSFALDATHLNLNGESKAKKSGNGAALKAVYTF